MSAGSAAEAVFREQYGRVIAGLIRACGSFEQAEEAMQEAFVSALSAWDGGVPDNPAAWIMTTARRKLIDAARRDRTRQENAEALRYESAGFAMLDESAEFPDDRLRLMFTCCHPALNAEARVALTLRTLGGLSTEEIARAFLVPEATLAQRLVRAKRKIAEARIPYETPSPDRLAERLSAVQAVVYLIFNEGYSSLRGELGAEAIRLARMLVELLPAEASNVALLALMLLQDSRRDARVRDGELVTLEDQDRSRWDRAEIEEGLTLVEEALVRGPIGVYALQAAIAALHASAAKASATDWAQIAALYERLFGMNPTPVVALNHAVAVAMAAGVERGLAMIERLRGLEDYYLFHAARADLLRRRGSVPEARAAYERALALVANPLERRYLERRLNAL